MRVASSGSLRFFGASAFAGESSTTTVAASFSLLSALRALSGPSSMLSASPPPFLLAAALAAATVSETVRLFLGAAAAGGVCADALAAAFGAVFGALAASAAGFGAFLPEKMAAGLAFGFVTAILERSGGGGALAFFAAAFAVAAALALSALAGEPPSGGGGSVAMSESPATGAGLAAPAFLRLARPRPRRLLSALRLAAPFFVKARGAPSGACALAACLGPASGAGPALAAGAGGAFGVERLVSVLCAGIARFRGSGAASASAALFFGRFFGERRFCSTRWSSATHCIVSRILSMRPSLPSRSQSSSTALSIASRRAFSSSAPSTSTASMPAALPCSRIHSFMPGRSPTPVTSAATASVNSSSVPPHAAASTSSLASMARRAVASRSGAGALASALRNSLMDMVCTMKRMSGDPSRVAEGTGVPTPGRFARSASNSSLFLTRTPTSLWHARMRLRQDTALSLPLPSRRANSAKLSDVCQSASAAPTSSVAGPSAPRRKTLIAVLVGLPMSSMSCTILRWCLRPQRLSSSKTSRVHRRSTLLSGTSYLGAFAFSRFFALSSAAACRCRAASAKRSSL